MTQTFSTIARNASEAKHPHLWRGLVGAWVPSLGVTGGTLRDVSGRGNHGTLTNMDPATDWVVSHGQYALDFDGTDDLIVSQSSQFELASPFTVSVWYRPTIRRPYAGILSTFDTFSEAATTGWILYDGAFSNNGKIGIILGGSACTTGPGNSELNRWQHYAAVFRQGAAKIYRNGVLQSLSTTNLGAASYSGTTQLKIGSYTATKGRNACQIADAVIHSREITPAEAMAIYQLGRGGMYQRRRRAKIYIQQAGFQAAWATKATTIAGVLR